MIAFLHHLVNPLLWFWLLVAGWWLAGRLRRAGLSRVLGWSAGIWLFLISTSPLPTWLAESLESRYDTLNPATLTPMEPGIHIVVLGGGHTHAPGFTAADRLSAEALGRLAEGIRLHRRLPGSRLVLSGYSLSGRQSQAETLAEAALDLGVDPADTLLLTRPRRTSEEAAAWAERFGPEQPLILVTSAIHLPRAMGWFRAQGAEPLPAPANHLVKRDPERPGWALNPSPAKVGMMQRGLHEYLGLLLQRLRTG